MGDAIMAFWNAPLDDPDHARNASGAALRMAARMADLNVKWREEAEAAGRKFNRVAIGIGINTGQCCVGNLGSEQRFDYSAIGDDVNVASRFEGLSKLYGLTIIIGEPTVAKMEGAEMLEVDLIRVKGRAAPTRIFTPLDVLGGAPEAIATLVVAHRRMLKSYRSQDWDGAEAAIADCKAAGFEALGAFYGLYQKRIAEFREAPPPADWDGADTATSK